jgi:hypothetical protein
MSDTTASMGTEPAPEVHTREVDLFHAGVSDKYGNVYVEKVGGGFDDPAEPVALLRARDNLAMRAMVYYKALCNQTPGVVERQVKSVERQVSHFSRWRYHHRTKLRLPGSGPR